MWWVSERYVRGNADSEACVLADTSWHRTSSFSKDISFNNAYPLLPGIQLRASKAEYSDFALATILWANISAHGQWSVSPVSSLKLIWSKSRGQQSQWVYHRRHLKQMAPFLRDLISYEIMEVFVRIQIVDSYPTLDSNWNSDPNFHHPLNNINNCRWCLHQNCTEGSLLYPWTRTAHYFFFIKWRMDERY